MADGLILPLAWNDVASAVLAWPLPTLASRAAQNDQVVGETLSEIEALRALLVGEAATRGLTDQTGKPSWH